MRKEGAFFTVITLLREQAEYTRNATQACIPERVAATLSEKAFDEYSRAQKFCDDHPPEEVEEKLHKARGAVRREHILLLNASDSCVDEFCHDFLAEQRLAQVQDGLTAAQLHLNMQLVLIAENRGKTK